MTEVPKIVHQRLGAVPPGNEHPDADLLTTFAEQGLAADERQNVLAHLALCGACREVIALALPEEQVVAAPVVVEVEPARGTRAGSPAPHKQRFAWAGLRWAALAAGVAVAAGVLLLNPGKLDKKPIEKPAAVAMVQPAQSSETNSSPSPTRSNDGPAPAPVDHSSADQKAPVDALDSAREKSNAPVKPASPSSSNISARVHAEPSSAPPTNAKLMTDKTMAKKIVDKDERDSRSADGIVATLPAESGNLSYQAQPIGSSSEAVEVSSASPAAKSADWAAPVVEKAKEVPPRLDANEEQPEKTATAGSFKAAGSLASTSNLATAQLLAPATWRISEGVLQRSLDGGHNWQASLHPGHLLLCYASQGSEIWAGGQSGVLYVSTNGGFSWTHVQLSSGGHPITADVTHIDMAGAQVVLTTSTNETWTSSDTGKTWEKK